MSDEIGTAANAAYEETVRIPSGVMRLLRASYDSRERVLDWLLALSVAGALCWAFRSQLQSLLVAPVGANGGRDPSYEPSQDVDGALPGETPDPNATTANQQTRAIYTYNMPPSRTTVYRRGPSGTRVPWKPGVGGQFPSLSGS